MEQCKSGKLRLHLHQWLKITNDAFIIQSIAGYKIEFESEPIQQNIPGEIPFSEEQKDIVDAEIQLLLQKGAIVPSYEEQNQFISTIFVVPKGKGKFRPVINLKNLNEFVKYEHFKQETFSVILELVQRNDFFTSIDLRDAYFSIPIHRESQKYLKFYWKGQLFSFICAPFGLSSIPRVFTKLLKPIFAWFRQQGIRCSYYIDDSLNMNPIESLCAENASLMADCISALGYDINEEKSVFVPTQRIKYFGFIIDSVLFMVFLPEEKVQKIKNMANFLFSEKIVVVRDLASFIGLVINAFHAVLESPLHYRPLERDKIRGLGEFMNFNQKVSLSPESLQELSWWIENIERKNGKSIRQQKSIVLIQTDASLQGWGAYHKNNKNSIGGRWSLAESNNHINYLELLAIFYALQAFCYDQVSIHISIQSDSSSAVSYITRMGGMTSKKMDLLATKIWQWCIERDLYISASHISSTENFKADFSSRHFSDSTEWMVKKDIFLRICDQCFIPDIDLFASRLNYRLERFVSWFPEPGAFKYDAFSFCWNEFQPYIFPPFNLISSILNKITQDRVKRAILVIPHWVSQPWFPLILSMIISFPIRLPRHRDLLTLPHNSELHPLRNKMSLVAVTVSGVRLQQEKFQEVLSKLYANYHRGFLHKN